MNWKSYSQNALRPETVLLSSEIDLELPLLRAFKGEKAFSYCGTNIWTSQEREEN